jgi:predicted aldo/keto reductase-like oxidoreductase
MTNENKNCSRRDFLKTAGAVGVGSMLAPVGNQVQAATRTAQSQTPSGVVPTRPFGKTGVNVSILSLGGMFDIPNNQLLMKQAVRWGVTYWDTAAIYEGGDSEKGIGKYFERYPNDREKIFLVSKSTEHDPKGMTRMLDRSLKRMKTSYVDLYFLHAVSRRRDINAAAREWAEQAKAEKKIRLFGFSTHRNMEELMLEGAKHDWIDGIMMTYNFRLMQEKRMQAAVAACVEAGIGLTAMKTQGGGQVQTNSKTELELGGRFLRKGFTEYQAKLKAVWENPHIASICSQMPNMTILSANTASAMDRTRLSRRDMDLLQAYADETACDYCAGCGNICEAAIQAQAPISDIMRYLMYYRSYGEHDRARAHFRQLPQEIRQRLLTIDYTEAERRCPQKMAIREIMHDAVRTLA